MRSGVGMEAGMGNRRLWFASIGVYLVTLAMGTVLDHVALGQGWSEATRMAALLAFIPVAAGLTARRRKWTH